MRRRVEPLRVVEDDRRVDEEAEHARADRVPERHRDEEVERPPPRGDVPSRAGELQRLEHLEPEERQRDDLEGGERRAERGDEERRAREVEVVEGADDPGAEVEQDREVRRALRRPLTDRADAREDEGERDRREHLEEVLDPQVHHPPAPVVRDGDVRPRRVGEPDRVEHRDRDRGVEEQVREPAAVLLRRERRLHRPVDEDEPEQHPGDEPELPDAPELDVLVALVPDEPAVRAGELPLHAEVGAGERADHDDDERAEEREDEGALPLRLVPVRDHRADEEPGREPAGRDPEHRELQVPAARRRVREDRPGVDPEQPVALDRVVAGHRPEERLEDEEQDRDGEERQRGALARGRPRLAERSDPDRLLGILRPHPEVGEDRDRGPEDQQDHRDDGPDERRGQRDVPDERVVREVRRVAERLAGPVRAGGPCGPEEERGHRPRRRWVGDEAARDRHRVRPLGEEPPVVRDERGNRGRLPGGEGERPGGGVVAVRPELRPDLRLDPPALARGERLELGLREARRLLRGEAACRARRRRGRCGGGRRPTSPARGRRRGPRFEPVCCPPRERYWRWPRRMSSPVRTSSPDGATRRSGMGGLCREIWAPPNRRTPKQRTMTKRRTARAAVVHWTPGRVRGRTSPDRGRRRCSRGWGKVRRSPAPCGAAAQGGKKGRRPHGAEEG